MMDAGLRDSHAPPHGLKIECTWHHLVEHYGPLAKTFDITLGELHADSI